MKEYGIIISDDGTGEDMVVYASTGPDALETVRRYLPEGKYYDRNRGVEYRVVERDVSEWKDFN